MKIKNKETGIEYDVTPEGAAKIKNSPLKNKYVFPKENPVPKPVTQVPAAQVPLTQKISGSTTAQSLAPAAEIKA